MNEFRCSPERTFEADRRLQIGSRWFSVAAGAARDAPRPASFWLIVLRRFGVIAAGVFFRGAVTQECGPVRQTLFRRRAIQFRSFRLVEWPLVRMDAQPLQAIQNSLHQFRLVALGICFLGAPNHRATLAPRE